MRPQQQNRRMRGRGGGGNNNNNRRGPNPLTRNYESNGPDVKIRGSAQQIAEKYGNLARDAQSAGDRVMAENYLQHAEHYNRIIAAAQAQMPQQQMRDQRDFNDSDDDEREETNAQASGDAQRGQSDDGTGPQPVIEGVPVEVEQEVASAESGEGQRQMNGGHVANGAEAEDNAPRRPRRPRRGRGRNEQEEASEGQPAPAENATAENEAGEITAPAAE